MPNELSGNGKHDHNGCENHEVGIQEEEHAGVVEAPPTPQAARSLCHAPRGNQQSENLPVRSMQVLYVRKAGQAQAGGKGAQREENGADKGFLPQAKDREEEMHNPSMYRGGTEGCCARRAWRMIDSVSPPRGSPKLEFRAGQEEEVVPCLQNLTQHH